MQIVIKITLSLAIILLAVGIGKKFPSLGGLIAVMPLTGLIVLLWLYSDTAGDPVTMQNYTKGALFGIIPTILFFAVALIGFRREWGLPAVLVASFGTWFVAAFFHQWFLK
ncbi:MAG TPA: DUF3147 family protein [Syntrophales bacterium]|jgi:uncharacterized membrane protein (GlpM family)|nr:DUF3147 family protein [Syntrophales bacterium]HPX55262.1 DUF3147 family protein [Syntrophales bacterium]